MSQGFSTRAIHAGYDPDPLTGAIPRPHLRVVDVRPGRCGRMRGGSSTHRQPDPACLEANLAALEGGGSPGLRLGDGRHRRPVARHAAPGRSPGRPERRLRRHVPLIDRCSPSGGIDCSVAPDHRRRRRARRHHRQDQAGVDRNPTNPLLNVGDIAVLAEITHGAGAKPVVDNTFASPYLQQPLALGGRHGAHSTTKYLGGHSDVVGGALITGRRTTRHRHRLPAERRRCGARPFDGYHLSCRGIKTLAVRMDRYSDNAERVVEYLATSRRSKVLYPGLADHPGHAVAAKQMSRYGGMVSVLVNGGLEAAQDFCARTEGVHPGRVARRHRVADRASGRDDARLDGRFAAGGS